MQRYELEKLSREELIVHASQLGVPRPRVLTQPELMDEIITGTAKSEREKAKARGWLGRARDLLAQVVEKKLHLPEAARVLRPGPDERTWPTPPPPPIAAICRGWPTACIRTHRRCNRAGSRGCRRR